MPRSLDPLHLRPAVWPAAAPNSGRPVTIRLLSGERPAATCTVQGRRVGPDRNPQEPEKNQSGPLVPVTVLTGFPRCGQDHAAQPYPAEQHGHKIAVIENEFGPENVDNELLVTETKEQIVEMNNGCICCTVRGDLVRILADLKRKRERRNLPSSA